MRVSELIAAFQTLPPNARVYLDDDEYPEIDDVIHDFREGDGINPPCDAVLIGIKRHVFND